MFTKYCKQCGVELSTDEIMHCEGCGKNEHIKIMYPGKVLKTIDLRMAGTLSSYKKIDVRKQEKPISMRIRMEDD